MKIELDTGEYAVARMLASMRNLAARSAGVKDARMDNAMNAIELDEIGLVSEIAWAKWQNTYPDLTTSARSGTYDSYCKGKRVDIKATKYKNGRLLAHIGKKDKDDVDMYVLAIVDGNVVDFVGYAMAHELLSDANIKDLGHGKGFAMDQSQLRRFRNV